MKAATRSICTFAVAAALSAGASLARNASAWYAMPTANEWLPAEFCFSESDASATQVNDVGGLLKNLGTSAETVDCSFYANGTIAYPATGTVQVSVYSKNATPATQAQICGEYYKASTTAVCTSTKSTTAAGYNALTFSSLSSVWSSTYNVQGSTADIVPYVKVTLQAGDGLEGSQAY